MLSCDECDHVSFTNTNTLSHLLFACRRVSHAIICSGRAIWRFHVGHLGKCHNLSYAGRAKHSRNKVALHLLFKVTQTLFQLHLIFYSNSKRRHWKSDENKARPSADIVPEKNLSISAASVYKVAHTHLSGWSLIWFWNFPAKTKDWLKRHIIILPRAFWWMWQPVFVCFKNQTQWGLDLS